MTDLSAYLQELMAEIRYDADVSGVMTVEAFFERMKERLTEAGEIVTADRAFYESGQGSQRLRIDGYSGDPRDSEGILGLIICDFQESDDVQTIGKADLPPLFNPLIRFLNKARDAGFRDSLNEVSPGFQLSDLVVATWPQITKIKLILLTNRHYVGKIDAVKYADVSSVPVTYSVWDLARFERYDRSGQAREDVVIDFANEFGGSLPALKASQPHAAFDSYLMIIPGVQLASIYDKWGARLLEANVRSFLQARAATNKGIQRTIRETPNLFFSYNNGISATADSVDVANETAGLLITRITNLQIVNGGQTTGSIHSALKTMKDRLTDVFVQMKLTVVPHEQTEEIVPRISEYANTQNKVNAADFFSNHPFHVRMEQFSRSIVFRPAEGSRHDTKWFYERARGQYLDAKSKLTDSGRKKFDLEYPKIQLISKTDLAKFEQSAMGYPHVVSTGAQKNFAEFAKEIAESWVKNEARFDETWFKRLVAKAIIFKFLESEVPKQAWYEGGYRANIVTYAMAKVFNDASAIAKSVLDVDAVWRRQAVSAPMKRALLAAAAEAARVITTPPTGVRNMSEWAKKQACWAALKSVRISYDDDFESCLSHPDDARTEVRQARSERALDDGIAAQVEVTNRGAAFWLEVLNWGRSNKLLTLKEAQTLEICGSMPRKMPTESQYKLAISTLQRLQRDGLALGSLHSNA